MPETLEQRLDEVEKKVAELGAIVGAGPGRKGWLATVGTLPNDTLAREADQLGREYRERLNDSDKRAGGSPPRRVLDARFAVDHRAQVERSSS